MDALVIDVGGSHVKLLATGQTEPRRFDSGKNLTPNALIAQVRAFTPDWKYDVVSLGYPGTVGPNGPIQEPGNLGHGWVGFDYEAGFGCPIRVVNDAAMQALGGYAGGRMLFLGLGTGLGSALVADHVVVPLELGPLPYSADETLAQRLGKGGRERHGHEAWMRALTETVWMLMPVFMADYLLLGGGNAEQVDPLPERVRRGGNEGALAGGFRLWEEQIEPHDGHLSHVWRVVR